MGDRGRRDVDIRLQGRRGPGWMVVMLAAACLLATASHARAETPTAEPGLDDLLRLPSDFETKEAAPPVAGVSEDEWRGRFTRAEKAIGDARDSLAATRRELDGLAETGGASQWSVAPPGAQGAKRSRCIGRSAWGVKPIVALALPVAHVSGPEPPFSRSSSRSWLRWSKRVPLYE